MNESWKDNAACVGQPTRLFVAEQGTGYHKGRLFCARCPVRQACLDYALEHSLLGLWGGYDDAERRTEKNLRELMASR